MLTFFVKYFPGTTVPRILKFGAKTDMTRCTVYRGYASFAHFLLYLEKTRHRKNLYD